tara:strand:+ start:291 stop:1313 length:1023 start_codon:yes stop_codon:yes gene_type:complete
LTTELKALLVGRTVAVVIALGNTHAWRHPATTAITAHALAGLGITEFTLGAVLLATTCAVTAFALPGVAGATTGAVRILLALTFWHPAGLRDALAGSWALRIGGAINAATNRAPLGDVASPLTDGVITARAGRERVTRPIPTVAETVHGAVGFALAVALPTLVFANAVEAALSCGTVTGVAAFRRAGVLALTPHTNLVARAVIVTAATPIVRLTGAAPLLAALTGPAIGFARAFRNLDLTVPVTADLIGGAVSIATTGRLNTTIVCPWTGITARTRLDARCIETDKSSGAVGISTTGRHAVFTAVTGNEKAGSDGEQKGKIKLRPHNALLCRRLSKASRD